MTKLQFKNLTTVEEILPTLPLINQMYPDITPKEYEIATTEMVNNNHYKMVAVYDESKLIAVAGYWILRMFYCGKYLQISNLVVDENYRSSGIGAQILDYLANYAKDQDCDHCVLDSYIDNTKSHKFFKRQGFYVRGLHFLKKIK